MERGVGEAGAVRRGGGFDVVSFILLLLLARPQSSGALQHPDVLGARPFVEHRDTVFHFVPGLQDAARHRTESLGVHVEVFRASRELKISRTHEEVQQKTTYRRRPPPFVGWPAPGRPQLDLSTLLASGLLRH